MALLLDFHGWTLYFELVFLIFPLVATLTVLPLLRDLYKRYGGRFGGNLSFAFLWMITSSVMLLIGNIVKAVTTLVVGNLTTGLLMFIDLTYFLAVFCFWFGIWIWWRYVK